MLAVLVVLTGGGGNGFDASWMVDLRRGGGADD